MQDIILDIIKTVVIALSGITTFYIRSQSEKKKLKKIDKTEHEKLFDSIESLQIENKATHKDISTISTSILSLQEATKHETFSNAFVAKIQIESLSFIYSMTKNNKELEIFLSSGVKRAISIFKNILNIGFENVSRQMVFTWFEIAEKALHNDFSSKEINLNSKEVVKLIQTERDVYIHNLFTVIKEKENGVRRAEFEKISNGFLNEIIKQIASL